jgi:hypothetical protein
VFDRLLILWSARLARTWIVDMQLSLGAADCMSSREHDAVRGEVDQADAPDRDQCVERQAARGRLDRALVVFADHVHARTERLGGGGSRLCRAMRKLMWPRRSA